jgi:hypothetical protein
MGHCPPPTLMVNDEIRKTITSIVLAGKPVVVFDNVKGRLSLHGIEAVATASRWEERLLGTNLRVSAPCDFSIVFTGNGVSCSPDLARRSVWVRLHSRAGNPAERRFRRHLEEHVLATKQRLLLCALWGLVKHWDELDRPKSCATMYSFPEWSTIFGGILESAWFFPVFDDGDLKKLEGDRDTADFEMLIQKAFVAAQRNGLRSEELVAVGRENGLFEPILEDVTGILADQLTRRAATRWGLLLKRYNGTSIGGFTFEIEGNGRARPYWIRGEGAPPDSDGVAPASA